MDSNENIPTFFSQPILKTPNDFTNVDSLHHPHTMCFKTFGYDNYVMINVPNNKLPPAHTWIDMAQKWLDLPGKNGKVHKFPLQTILPKVLLAKRVKRKELPRDVEVDRLRKRYAKFDLLQSLNEAGLTAEELLPTEEQYELLSENAFKHFLPISFFDDFDYDSQSWVCIMDFGSVECYLYF